MPRFLSGGPFLLPSTLALDSDPNSFDDPEVVPEALLRTDIFVPVAGEAQS
jgi:hypothetical protein